VTGRHGEHGRDRAWPGHQRHREGNQDLFVRALWLLIVLNLRRRAMEYFEAHQEHDKPAGRLKRWHRDGEGGQQRPRRERDQAEVDNDRGGRPNRRARSLGRWHAARDG
jgi:hypothetical protein